jgi:hypothetical protein
MIQKNTRVTPEDAWSVLPPDPPVLVPAPGVTPLDGGAAEVCDCEVL